VLASPVFLMQHLNLNEFQFGWLFIPTVCGMVLGSYLAKRAAGKMVPRRVMQIAYAWMTLMVISNLLISYLLPPYFIYNILPVALFNVGMALAMPILSIAALDRHPKIRGTAASGQAFVQMLLSTVSAGLIVPFVWFSPLGLAMAMAGYVLIGWLVIRKTQLWLGQ
jgi:MFS transporter, DHA1 family, multidrug resistance protein